jgi:hypothetical protein
VKDIKTIKTDIDIERIYTELETFVLNEDKFQDQINDSYLSVQICLQGIDAEMDPYFGSRTLKHITDEGFDEEDFNVFLFPELDYTNSIIEDLNMFRTRVMILKPKTCLSLHADPRKRIHIPIDTNENCFLMIDQYAHHLPADGSAYLVDTTKLHTPINASLGTNRMHIVGANQQLT